MASRASTRSAGTFGAVQITCGKGGEVTAVYCHPPNRTENIASWTNRIRGPDWITKRATEPIGHRPAWVWTIVGIYLLLAGAIVLLPVWAFLLSGRDLLTAASITACVLTLSGMGLLFTPVQQVRRRPVTRRSVWIPILSAGTLLAALVFAAGIATDEYYTGDPNASQHTSSEDSWETGIFVATGATWLGWAILFALLVRRGNPESLSMRINRWVLAGSVAELLVAVPLHIIVRKRSVCCAGYMTGAAIGIGAAVMIVAFGPGVFLLYRRRWKQIQNH